LIPFLFHSFLIVIDLFSLLSSRHVFCCRSEPAGRVDPIRFRVGAFVVFNNIHI